MPELGWSAFSNNSRFFFFYPLGYSEEMQSDNKALVAHTELNLSTQAHATYRLGSKQRYICGCVCVWLRMMWHYDPHPDAREGPINIHRHQECETHEATDLPLPLSLINHSMNLLFSLYLKNDLKQSVLDDNPDILYASICLRCCRKRTKLQKAAHSITIMLYALVRDTWRW